MPVQIDEITAEIAPAASDASSAPASAAPGASETSPEIERRKLRDSLARLEARAARVCAD